MPAVYSVTAIYPTSREYLNRWNNFNTYRAPLNNWRPKYWCNGACSGCGGGYGAYERMKLLHFTYY
jgi:hypothetical protein